MELLNLLLNSHSKWCNSPSHKTIGYNMRAKWVAFKALSQNNITANVIYVRKLCTIITIHIQFTSKKLIIQKAFTKHTLLQHNDQ